MICEPKRVCMINIKPEYQQPDTGNITTKSVSASTLFYFEHSKLFMVKNGWVDNLHENNERDFNHETAFETIFSWYFIEMYAKFITFGFVVQ